MEGFPPERINEGLPYSARELLEHLRITQWDILEFSGQTYLHEFLLVADHNAYHVGSW